MRFPQKRFLGLRTGGYELRLSGKWLLIGISIGVVAGFGAVIFFYLLEWSNIFFMNFLCGYVPPSPGGEVMSSPIVGEYRRWAFLFVPAIGGLLAGLLVYTFAPEAEGHGTDAVIDSFHNQRGIIRKRVPVIKTISSILTIGSGGSAGREGPIAQIGAGFGSFLATRLKLTSHERRQMVIAGAAGGIGSIFKTPLGGAIFSAEVLYKEDIEAGAIIPSVISSIVAYSIFSSFHGWGRLFSSAEFKFTHPVELIFYAILGVFCALMGGLYIKIFYGLRDFFHRIPIKSHFKPALGGLLLGVLGFFFPQVLGMGYGWVQQAINGELTIQLLLTLGLLKMLATGFTISSGGSGGVFAPSLFIGGMLGGAFGLASQSLFPQSITQPTAFVVVGMGAFFAGAANVPISALFMVCEMTGGYGLLVPMMLVSATAFLFGRRWSIYEKQVPAQKDSPAHIGDFTVNILEQIKVRDAFTPQEDVPLVYEHTPVRDLLKMISQRSETYFPVINEKHELRGIISLRDIRTIFLENGLHELVIAADLMTRLVVVTPDEDLYSANLKFIESDYGMIPVVDPQIKDKVLGYLTHEDLIGAYNREMVRRKFPGE
ncbi:MAG: chloride channel protein [Gemmatimonadota bacterium]|nr:MAG: chloride channel protein [Gemmatimonadota bacterium]